MKKTCAEKSVIKLIPKLNLNKESISQLNNVKGGAHINTQHCICKGSKVKTCGLYCLPDKES